MTFRLHVATLLQHMMVAYVCECVGMELVAGLVLSTILVVTHNPAWTTYVCQAQHETDYSHLIQLSGEV